MSSGDLRHLRALPAERFALGPYSLHGPDHWQRVERNGLDLPRVGIRPVAKYMSTARGKLLTAR